MKKDIRQNELGTTEFSLEPTRYSGSVGPNQIPKLLMKSTESLDSLTEERKKRQVLRSLLNQQTEINEGLREENDCLQQQQRALLNLLQEKDKQLQALKKRQDFCKSPIAQNTVISLDPSSIGFCRISNFIQMRISSNFSLFRIAILEKEKSDILAKLEELKIESERKRELMAYQQFELTMQHFGKSFETMQKKRKLLAMSHIIVHAVKKDYSQLASGYSFGFIIKKIISKSFNQLVKSSDLIITENNSKTIATKRLVFIMKKIVSNKLNFYQNQINISSIISKIPKIDKAQIFAKSIKSYLNSHMQKQIMGKFKYWKAAALLKKDADKIIIEKTTKMERISNISKQMLILSKFTSICESALKIHKLVCFDKLRNIAKKLNKEDLHKTCKMALTVSDIMLRKINMKNSFLMLKSALAINKNQQNSNENTQKYAIQMLMNSVNSKIKRDSLYFMNSINAHILQNEKATDCIVFSVNKIANLLSKKFTENIYQFMLRVQSNNLQNAVNQISQQQLKLVELQEQYDQLSMAHDNNMMEMTHFNDLRTENETNIAKIAELEHQNLELRNLKAELQSTNSKLLKDKETLINQIKDLESQLLAQTNLLNKSPVNVSFQNQSFKEKSMAKYEETILELNKSTSERLVLNTKLSEKEDEILKLLRIRRELEELAQENARKANDYHNEAEMLRKDNENIKAEFEILSQKCNSLTLTVNQKQEELTKLQEQNSKLEISANDAAKIKILETELEEKRKSAIALASTIDGLANDKQNLVEQLEKCMKDITTLKESFTKQKEISHLLKEQTENQEEEIHKLQASNIDISTEYKTHINSLESENNELHEQIRALKSKKTQSSSKKPKKSEISTEIKQIIDQLKENNSRLQNTILEKNEQIEKLKQQISELTKELVDSSKTIAEQQSRVKEYEDRIKKLTAERSKVQEKLEISQQEVSMHRKEAESMMQVRQASKLEKNTLEQQNQRLLNEIENLQKELKAAKEQKVGLLEYNKVKADYQNAQQKVGKYDEELSSMQRKLKEYELESTKNKRDVEEYKKLLEQRKIDVQKCHVEMENYAKILEALERNTEKLQAEKERAERDKNKAIEEVTAIRKRYMNILGVDNLPNSQ